MSQYKDIPQPTDQRNVSQNDILTNYRYLATPLGGPAAGIPNGIIPVDHFASGDNVANPTDGFHKQSSYVNRAIPASLTNATNGQPSSAIEYAFSDGAGQSQPYWLNGSINSPMMPIRAFVLFDGSQVAPAAPILGVSYNVNNPGGVVKNSTGNYTVSFSVPLPTINYIILANAENPNVGEIYTVNWVAKTVNGFTLQAYFTSQTTAGVRSPPLVAVTVIGIF